MAELSPQARKLFEAPNLGVVATIGKDGAPRATPVWVDVDDEGNILLNSKRGRGWPANAERDPRVTVTVVDGENPWTRNVTATGRVVEITEDGADEHIEAVSEKYGRKGQYGHGDRVKVKIVPDRIHEYGF